MAWSVRQSAVADANDPTATFGTTPLSGSLLVGIAQERSGAGVAGLSVSAAGWTSRATRDQQLTNASFRNSCEVWVKTAGASEPTAVQLTTQGGTVARWLIVELQTDASETATFDLFSATDTGTTSPAFLNTPSIAVTATELCVVAFAIRNGDPPPSSDGLDSGHEINLNVVNSSNGSNGRHIVFGAEVHGSVEAAAEAQYSHGSGVNTGMIGIILRFDVAGGGGASHTVNPADSVTVADAISFGRTITFGDTLSLADALAFGRTISFADTLSIADNVAAQRGLNLSFDDSVTLSDQIGGYGFGRLIEDIVSLADAISLNREITFAEAITLADAIKFDREITLSDLLSIADQVGFGREISFADALSLADQATPELTPGEETGLTQDVADTLSLSDAILLEIGRHLLIADSVSINDSVARQLNGAFLSDATVEAVKRWWLSRPGWY